MTADTTMSNMPMAGMVMPGMQPLSNTSMLNMPIGVSNSSNDLGMPSNPFEQLPPDAIAAIMAQQQQQQLQHQHEEQQQYQLYQQYQEQQQLLQQQPAQPKPDFFEYKIQPLPQQLFSLLPPTSPQYQLPELPIQLESSSSSPNITTSAPPPQVDLATALNVTSQANAEFTPSIDFPHYQTPTEAYNTAASEDPYVPYPNWKDKEEELIQHYKDHCFEFIETTELTKSVWSELVLSLIPKFDYLRSAVMTLSSLHLDYLSCIESQVPFEASDLSMFLYNSSLASCGKECCDINTENFEALFFTTSLIMVSSYRLEKTIPLFSESPGHVDLLSLSKGPVSILIAMREHITSSPLVVEFMHGTHHFEKFVHTKLCDNLIEVCQMLSDDMELNLDMSQVLDALRHGPASPPVDEPLVDQTSKHQVNPFLTKHSLLYLKMNPLEPNYYPDISIKEDEEDGLTSPDRSDDDRPTEEAINFQKAFNQQQQLQQQQQQHLYQQQQQSNDQANVSPESYVTTTPSPSLQHNKLKTSLQATEDDDSDIPSRKASCIEVLTVLRLFARKVVAMKSFTRLHLWRMLLNRQFLTMLREDRHPFALIIMAHYLAFMLFQKPYFWLFDRLLNEIKKITEASPKVMPHEWSPLLKWPRLVVDTIEERRRNGNYEMLGIELFAEMVDYTI